MLCKDSVKVFAIGVMLVATVRDAAAEPFDVAAHYKPAATRILDAVQSGNDAYRKLEELCDGIGHRLSGSVGMEKAVRWAVDTLKKDGHENVAAEPVKVPKWVRGAESLTMIEPWEYSMPLLGLGRSVATPPGGIQAEVIAVQDEEQLKGLGSQVEGKIVLFNNAHEMNGAGAEKPFSYGTAVRFRHSGAAWAAEQGAVACLVRSVTPRSLRSPHTGAMSYGDSPRKIPAAAITTEDADMIQRLLQRGQRVAVRLHMEARDEGLADSANVVAELRGSTHPEEVVVISGYLDSWDVGQGAHDDGGPCVVAMEALNVLRKLDLRPRRTIRVVLWTNEENGLAGAKQYVKDHADELPRHVAAIEADSGVFQPRGYGVSVENPEQQKTAVDQLTRIVSLLEPIGANKASDGGGGADIGQMKSAGVPLLGFEVDSSLYFHYHHTHADTLDKIDPADLTRCVASMAVMAYVLADMPVRLGEPFPEK